MLTWLGVLLALVAASPSQAQDAFFIRDAIDQFAFDWLNSLNASDIHASGNLFASACVNFLQAASGTLGAVDMIPISAQIAPVITTKVAEIGAVLDDANATSIAKQSDIATLSFQLFLIVSDIAINVTGAVGNPQSNDTNIAVNIFMNFADSVIAVDDTTPVGDNTAYLAGIADAAVTASVAYVDLIGFDTLGIQTVAPTGQQAILDVGNVFDTVGENSAALPAIGDVLEAAINQADADLVAVGLDAMVGDVAPASDNAVRVRSAIEQLAQDWLHAFDPADFNAQASSFAAAVMDALQAGAAILEDATVLQVATDVEPIVLAGVDQIGVVLRDVSGTAAKSAAILPFVDALVTDVYDVIADAAGEDPSSSFNASVIASLDLILLAYADALVAVDESTPTTDDMAYLKGVAEASVEASRDVIQLTGGDSQGLDIVAPVLIQAIQDAGDTWDSIGRTAAAVPAVANVIEAAIDEADGNLIASGLDPIIPPPPPTTTTTTTTTPSTTTTTTPSTTTTTTPSCSKSKSSKSKSKSSKSKSKSKSSKSRSGKGKGKNKKNGKSSKSSSKRGKRGKAGKKKGRRG